MSGEEPTHYEERSIAFIDILGFKEHVMKADKDPAFFPTILGALHAVKDARDAWPTFATQEGIPPEETKARLDFRSDTFSDSIVFSERGAMVAPLLFAVSRLTM